MSKTHHNFVMKKKERKKRNWILHRFCWADICFHFAIHCFLFWVSVLLFQIIFAPANELKSVLMWWRETNKYRTNGPPAVHIWMTIFHFRLLVFTVHMWTTNIINMRPKWLVLHLAHPIHPLPLSISQYSCYVCRFGRLFAFCFFFFLQSATQSRWNTNLLICWI